jgi:HEAT repeat protein
MNNIQNKINWLTLCSALFYTVLLPCQAEEPPPNLYSPQELQQALQSSDPALREEAAGRFVESAPFWPMSEVMPIALVAISDQQAVVRAYGIESLATSAMGSSENAAKLKDAAPILLKSLSDPDWKVRQYAAGAFSYMQPSPPPETAPALIAMLDDANEKVAEAAMDSLVAIGFSVPDVPAKLLAMVKHPNPYLQRHAIIDLQHLWQDRKSDVDPAVIQTLKEALTHQDKEVRRQAVDSLSSFGVKAEVAIPELEERAADPKETKGIRDAAKSSIGVIKGEPAPLPMRPEDSLPAGSPSSP